MHYLNDLQFLKYFISDAVYPYGDQKNNKLKDFYNQYSIHFEELLGNADKILDRDDLTKLYLVALYLEEPVKLKSKTYPIFIEAYRNYLIEFKSTLSNHKIVGPLFFYGFDQFSPYAESHSFEQYKKLKKLYNRMDSYLSIGGHLNKMDFFKEAQDYAKNAINTLEHMNKYEFYYRDKTTLYLIVQSFALLALFNPTYQSIFLEKYLKNYYLLFEDSTRVFSFYCEQMLKQYGHAIFSSDAHVYIEQIIESQNIIKKTTDSNLWRTKLDLNLPLKDWRISIKINLKNGSYIDTPRANDGSIYSNFSYYRQAYICLILTSDTEHNWDIRVESAGKKYYQRSNESCHRNELDIPLLPQYGLLKFPEWLKIINKDYAIDWENITISGLRKTVEKQKIMQWLLS